MKLEINKVGKDHAGIETGSGGYVIGRLFGEIVSGRQDVVISNTGNAAIISTSSAIVVVGRRIETKIEKITKNFRRLLRWVKK